MTRLEAIDKIQELIRDERQHWCQFTLAKTIDDHPCSLMDPAAAKWCLAGALRHVCDDQWPAVNELMPVVMLAIESEYPGSGMASVNDRIGHTAVMQVLDRAREIVKEKEPNNIPSS